MQKYVFNARDIAAYIKWFSVPSFLETTYMQYVFSLGKLVLAKPLTHDFEYFKHEVYRELYYLWANGFENDKSDISNMHQDGMVSLICDQECINLESYMKLITMHLIFSQNLPYVRLNFSGLPLTLSLDCEYEVFEANVVKAIKKLNLCCRDQFGKPFDIELGVPDEVLCVSLEEDIRQYLISKGDFKSTLRLREKEFMTELKIKSAELNGNVKALMNNLIKPSSRKSNAKKAEPVVYETSMQAKDSRTQPHGASGIERSSKK